MNVPPQSLANLLPAWKPGQSGNPGGKPVGARNRINAKFLDALEKDFAEGGIEAIKKCRESDPSGYIRALIALQPKEMEIVKSPFTDLTDDELQSIFTTCRAILDASDGGTGDRGSEGAQPAQDVPAVSEAS